MVAKACYVESSAGNFGRNATGMLPLEVCEPINAECFSNMQHRMLTCMLALLGLVIKSSSCARVGLTAHAAAATQHCLLSVLGQSACCACYPSFPARCCCVSEQMTLWTGKHRLHSPVAAGPTCPA
jgi:hypothetical protein